MLAFSNQLLTHHELDDLMNFLVREVRRLLAVDACAVLMPAEDPAYLVFRAADGWRDDPVAAGRQLPAAGSGSGRALRMQEAVIIPDTAAAEIYPALAQEWLAAEGFHSTAAIPLIAQSNTVGALVVNVRARRAFSEDEIRFLQLMANQAALAIEQARLRSEEIARQRLEDELALGRQIQLSLLPTSSPTYPGWEFGHCYQAAHSVGGDLYDFFDLDDPGERLGVVIGDVSDKGVPAALFMGVSRTVIRTAALGNRPPAAALEWSNQIILKESYSSYFLSAFYAILEYKTGRLCYSNAGHNPPLLYRPATNEFDLLTTDGIVLGVLPAIALEEKEVEIGHGDVLIFYTDGVTEAMNVAYDEFGVQRLQEAVRARASDAATDILWEVVERVNAFTAPVQQNDDFTLVVIKRL
jgi:sigma-B regulation protein RsbU (phosphoserine phosphatase)